jgi:alpha-2-macroglobulin
VSSFNPLLRRGRLLAFVALIVVFGAKLAAADTPSRLEALRQRLQKGAPDAAAVQLGREAIAEARLAGNDDGLRDALVATARMLMSVEGFEAGMRLLREEAWPASGPAQVLLHSLAAEALLTQAWRPEGHQGFPSAQDLSRLFDEFRRNELFLSRVAEAERHLDAAWALRDELPDSLEVAFGPDAYRSAEPRLVETARDTISNLFSRVLARREAWRGPDVLFHVPAQSLLAPPETCPGDATVHPLVRAAAVLRDLESWHLSGGRREAALRALRTAAKTLGTTAWNTERATVLDAFATRFRAYRDLPSFSEGLAELAFLHWEAGYSRVEAKARMRVLAQEGRDAHPGTPGARRCESMLAGGAGTLQLTGMSHDGPGKRSLCLSSRGLGVVHLFAYRLEPEESIPLLADESGPVAATARRLLREASPAATWAVQPSTPDDGEMHKTWITPPLVEKGVYLVVASVEPDLEKAETLVSATPIVLTDLVVLTRSDEERGTEVVVVSGTSGEPQPSVTLRRLPLAEHSDNRPPARVVTGADGRAWLPPPPHGTPTVIVASRGSDFAVMQRTWGRSEEPEQPAMLFADRHRYRPGERVRFFYLSARFDAEPGRLVPDSGKVVAVTLSDGTGRALRRLRPTTDAFGVASGALTIPYDRAPGVWQIEVEDDDGTSDTFEVVNDGGMRVSLALPNVPIRPGQPVSVPGRLTGPDAAVGNGASVRWSLRGDNALLDFGETTVDQRGTFTLAPKTLATLPERSLELEVLVSSGPYELRAAGTIPFAENLRLHLQMDTYWLRPEDALAVAAVRERGDVPAPGESRFRVVRLRAPEAATLPGDEIGPAMAGMTEDDRRVARSFRSEYSAMWRWELPEVAEAAAGVLVHGQDGEGRAEVPGLGPGLYRIDIETDDGAGGTLRGSWRFLVLTRDGQVPFGVPWLLLPGSDSSRSDKPWLTLQHCGFPEQLFNVERYHDGTRLFRRALRQSRIAAFSLTPCRPGAWEDRLWYVRDHQLITSDSPWNVTCDDENLRVSAELDGPDALVIGVASPDGKRLRRGETEVIVLFAPPEYERREVDDETPEPFILKPRPRSTGRLEASLGEVKGALVTLPSASIEQPIRLPQPGTLRPLIGSGVRDPGALANSRATEQAPVPVVQSPETSRVVPEPDPLTFQPHLSPGTDGLVRVSLPDDLPSNKVWVLALSKGMKYGFAEFVLTTHDSGAK